MRSPAADTEHTQTHTHTNATASGKQRQTTHDTGLFRSADDNDAPRLRRLDLRSDARTEDAKSLRAPKKSSRPSSGCSTRLHVADVARLVSLSDHLDDRVFPAHTCVIWDGDVAGSLAADGDLLLQLYQGHFGVPSVVGDELPAARTTWPVQAISRMGRLGVI